MKTLTQNEMRVRLEESHRYCSLLPLKGFAVNLPEGIYHWNGDVGLWAQYDTELERNRRIQMNIMTDVFGERRRQDNKWGSQKHLSQERWMTIITEEVGEVANAILEKDIKNLKVELVQVAAVCVAFAEALESAE